MKQVKKGAIGAFLGVLAVLIGWAFLFALLALIVILFLVFRACAVKV